MAVFTLSKAKKKRIPGFGGKYEVTDMGDVFSRGCLLEPVRGQYVSLSGEFGVQQFKIAYLVARAFIPNMEARPYVVHKNGDRFDNRACNLMWSEEKESKPRRQPSGVGVLVYKRCDGGYIGTFPTLRNACDVLRLDYSNAKRVLEGKSKYVKGYILRWV